MKKFIFLLSLYLVLFVVFSSTTFTTQNPIELPSGNSVPVLDTDGKPLDPQRVSYRIISTGRGAVGGDVYLGPSLNSSAPCDNGVFRHNSDIAPTGTPVVGTSLIFESVIFENQDINILFAILVVDSCVPYAIWKVGDYDASLGARLLETGGSICQGDSSWFRIVKSGLGYNLLYCPGPFACPSCPLYQCQAVGEVIQEGKRRLALVNDRPLSVNFRKVSF